MGVVILLAHQVRREGRGLTCLGSVLRCVGGVEGERAHDYDDDADDYHQPGTLLP